MKVAEIIEKNAQSNRVTLNDELYLKLVAAVTSDDEYVAKEIKSVNDKGDIVTEDRHLSQEFKKILAAVIKKSTSMTEAEALEAAGKYQLTADQAKSLAAVVHEADYLAIRYCNKKVKPFNKPDFSITLAKKRVGESVRPNPQDRKKAIKIAAHDTVKATMKVPESMKKVVKE